MANKIVVDNFWAVAPMDPQPVLTPASAGPPGPDGSGGPGGSGGSGGDLPGRVEVRGIDHIPDAERHGRPRELFWVWFAANITYLYFVLGGVVLLLGLTLWQSVLVLVVGNLYWVGVGTLAISGPPSGTPSVVVTRAMYGVRGNRPFSAGIGWLVAIAYEAVNLALGALAGFALADHVGLTVSGPVKVIVLLFTAAVTFAVSIFGHATIVRLSPYFTAVLATVMVLLAVFVLREADTGYVPKAPLHGADLWATLTIGVAIIAAVPLSWANGADYARYLPRTVSLPRVLAHTALGAFLPAVVLGVLGVLAGTRIDMGDPQGNLADIVPGWFYPVFLFVIVFSSITNNILTAYSSGLCLQSMGLRVSRARSVFLDAALSMAIASYALFVHDFTDTLSRLLEMTVVVLAPSMALYVADIVLRRNRYDGVALHDETRTSRFWYRGGFNVAGVAALATGTAVSVLCVNTSDFQGPLSEALAGSDVSFVVGPALTVAVYAALWRRSERSVRPQEAGRG